MRRLVCDNFGYWVIPPNPIGAGAGSKRDVLFLAAYGFGTLIRWQFGIGVVEVLNPAGEFCPQIDVRAGNETPLTCGLLMELVHALAPAARGEAPERSASETPPTRE